MVEIALSLAIIGFALVAIIGALTKAMPIQRINREQTVINQDATVFLEAIRGGARGMNDLTNYVFMITNTYAHVAYSNFTSGAEIVGLLSAPEFVDADGNPIPDPSFAVPSYSNRMVAFVYSINGPAVEKPPQVNDSVVRQSSFSYGVVCQNLPVQTDTTNLLNEPYNQQLTANLRELRLTFLWPLLPDSQPPRAHYGPGRQSFRTEVAGQLALDTNTVPGMKLYFYQPQIFTKAP